MNVYLVMEDGESRCYAAPNMAAALEAAWQKNLADETEAAGEPFTAEEAETERDDWETGILQSVTLVGELENVDDLAHLAAAAIRPDWVMVAECLETAARVAESEPVTLEPGPEPTNEALALMTAMRTAIAAAIRSRKGERKP